MAQPPKKESLGLTTDLAKKLIKAFPQYKGLSHQDFLNMLNKISAVETQDKNIYQLKGGPGRGYYQMELESAPVAYDRALNIQKELKERGVDLPKLPRYNQDFTKLTKDEQAFYTLAKMVGAAGAKRLQGEKDYYLNPKNPKKMWLELHWAGKAEDKPARIKHWEETHGKEALVPQKIKTLKQEISKPTPQPTSQVEQEIDQPDLHPAGPEKITVSAPSNQPVLSNKRVKQLANTKFVPNPIGIPIFTKDKKPQFIWDKPAGELDIMLYGRPGPTMRRAQAMENAEAVEPEFYAAGGMIKRADGSYSRRGLWDNIRANRGSGRKPTKEMLRQEKKIRAAEKKEDGGPIYNWIPPNYPRVGARNEQGGWLDRYDDGGNVPHDYMYNEGNVSSYLPGTSVHPMGITNVPDSPCGPGFTIQYDETGNPVCMPIATPAPSAPTAPTPPTVLAGANEMDYMLFNPAVYSSQPLETYSEQRIGRVGRSRSREPRPVYMNVPRYEVPEKTERFVSTKPATRKAIRASSLNRRPFLSGLKQMFKRVGNTIQRCLPGDECYKFEDGSWVADSSIPTPTTPSYYPAYPDKTLTNYQMGTPKSTLPIRGLRDATPETPAYAHGATVWTDQDTSKWAAGTPTRTITQRITPPRAHSPGTAVPYPEIKITGPTDPYGPASPPVLQGYNPYKGPMRLHAPDTTMIARNGGYVPMYKKGGFLSALGDIGLGIADTTLGTVGSVTGIKSMQDIIDEDQYADDKFDDVAGFTGKVAGTALKVIPVTAPFAAAAGAVGTAANRALKIDENYYDPTQHTSAWDKIGGGIESVGSIASMFTGNIGGAAGAAGKLSKAAQTANTITKGANLLNAGMGFTQGLGQGQLDFNSLMNLYGGIQGLQGNPTSNISQIKKKGGYITKKYNPPGLRYQALNPGVSAPTHMYSGPTTQRGVTFGNGGWLDSYENNKNINKDFYSQGQIYDVNEKEIKRLQSLGYKIKML